MKKKKVYKTSVGVFLQKKQLLLLSCLAVLLCGAAAATAAWLMQETGPVENTFSVASVTTEVEEEFDGEIKSNVTAINTGDIDAYIRIKLISYRVNDEGDQIGGTALINPFTPGEGWVSYDGYYYYTAPVAPGNTPDSVLLDEYTLVSYDDADGGRQVIEVMAEAIQCEPAEVVGEAWGVMIVPGSVTPYTSVGE